MTTWTRITDPDAAVELMPAWFGARMMATRGRYGFLLGTGDVARVSRVTAVHVAANGTVLVDVLLDSAGVPPGVDTAWVSKHFLGAAVAGGTLATLNLSQVVMAVEFEVPEFAESAYDLAVGPALAVSPGTASDEPVETEAVGTPA